jgi:hypothetical protein
LATTKPEIPVHFAKVEAVGTDGPANWANVFYFGMLGTPSTAPVDCANAAAIAVGNFYDSVFADQCYAGWRVTTTKVTYRDADDSLVRFTVADAIVGGFGGNGEAAQVCYLVNWQTGDPRKGGKPRTYVAGVPEGAMLDSANLGSDTLTAINTGLSEWLTSNLSVTSGDQTGVELVDMSFRDGNAWRDAATWYPIFSGFCSPVVATQRRRIDRLRP